MSKSKIIGSVIILANEDDAAHTIRPRLDAAGADTNKVYIVEGVAREGKQVDLFQQSQHLRFTQRRAFGLIGPQHHQALHPVADHRGQCVVQRRVGPHRHRHVAGGEHAHLGAVTLGVFSSVRKAARLWPEQIAVAVDVRDGKVVTLNVEGPGKFEVSDAGTLLAQAKA